MPFSPAVAAHLTELATLPAREAAEQSAPVVYASATAADIRADIDIRMSRPTSRPGYFGQLMAVGRYAGTLPRLPLVQHPVLVIHGTQDRLVPPGNAEILARAIPGATTHLVTGAGHIFTTDATAETISTILDFVAEHDRTIETAPHA